MSSPPSKPSTPSPTSTQATQTTGTTSTTPSPHESTLEDIFPATSQHPSDSPRLRSIHATAGYRDGASSAREAAVQGGFDEGFLLGAAVGARVGLLIGVVEGITSVEGSVEVRGKVRGLLDRMRGDLALENVLGSGYVLADGSWGWDVPGELLEKGGVDAVAEEHPLIKLYAGVVGRWVRELGLRRVDGMEDG